MAESPGFSWATISPVLSAPCCLRWAVCALLSALGLFNRPFSGR
jgi:hypothetical protein